MENWYEYDENKLFYPLIRSLSLSENSEDGVSIMESDKRLMLVVKEIKLNANNSTFVISCGYRSFNINKNYCYFVAFMNINTKKIKGGYIFYKNNKFLYGENWEQENYYWDETIQYNLKKIKKSKIVYANDNFVSEEDTIPYYSSSSSSSSSSTKLNFNKKLKNEDNYVYL